MVVIVTIYQEAFVTVCIFQTTWFLQKVKKHAPTIFSFKKLTASEKVHRDIHLGGHVIKPLKPDWKMTGLSFEQTGKPAPKEWFKFVPSSVKISRVIMKKSRKCKSLRITSMHRRTPGKMWLKFSFQLSGEIKRRWFIRTKITSGIMEYYCWTEL